MNNKDSKDQNKVLLVNVLSTVILQGLAFFTSPYFSRTLGANNFGVVSVYATWVQVASIIYGLRINGTIAMAQREYPENAQKSYQSSVLFLSLIAYAGFSILTFLIATYILKINILMTVMTLLHGFGLYCVNFANSKFTFEFHADYNFVLSVAISISTILLSMVLINLLPSKINYWGRIVGEAVPYTLFGVIFCFIIIRGGKSFFNKSFWRFCIPLALPLVFHGLSGLILNQSDRIMLQYATSDTIVGIYSLACTFSNVVFVCWSALNNSWVPFYYKYTRNKQVSSIKLHAKNYLELFSVLSIGFMLLAPEVYHWFAEKDYWGGTTLIPVFTIGSFFVFLYSFPINYEIYYKKTTVIALGTAAAACCNIMLNVLFIKIWGAYGAAIATAIAYGIQFFFHHLCAKYLIKDGDYPFSLKMLLPYAMIVVLFAVFNSLTSPWVIRWGMGVALGIIEIRRIYRRRSIF